MRVAPVIVSAFLVSIPCLSEAQHSFDLDVPEGVYSFWKFDELRPQTAIEVDVEIRRLRRHRQWAPSFQFALEGGQKRAALVFVGRLPDNSITAGIRFWDGNTEREVPVPGLKVALKERVKLRLDWTTRGALAVSANGASYGSFKLDFTPTALTVVASTGQMVGHRLDLKITLLESSLSMREKSERVVTAHGIRRRVSAKHVEETPYAVWNAFVRLLTEEYDSLSPAQRPAHLAFMYDSEVQNGGHYQYFENRSDERGEETATALRKLDLTCQADVLDKTLKKWREQDRRAAESVDRFVDYAKEFDRLDYAYHECRPTTSDGLKAHLKRHRQEFVLVEPE